MKELLLYSSISNYSAERFINDLEANKDQDIVLRINTDGGSPESGFGMIAKFSEHTEKKSIKVDGKAYSMGTFFLAYSQNNEALDVSEFLIHRAAYADYFEKSEMMTEAMWENLNRINGKLRVALEAKINVPKFEKLKGVTLDEIFSNDSRKEVFLSADEALSIGLVDRITQITPERKAEIESRMFAKAAQFGGNVPEKRFSIAEYTKAFRSEFMKAARNNTNTLEESEAKLKAALKASNETTIVFNFTSQEPKGWLNREQKPAASKEKLAQFEKRVYGELGLGKEVKNNQYTIVHAPSPREIVEGRVLGTSK